MSDLFGNHIVGFPKRWLICVLKTNTFSSEKTYFVPHVFSHIVMFTVQLFIIYLCLVSLLMEYLSMFLDFYSTVRKKRSHAY